MNGFQVAGQAAETAHDSFYLAAALRRRMRVSVSRGPLQTIKVSADE